MDPLQWMGAVRMRVQTADKNITIIHTTPAINILWNENNSMLKNFHFKQVLYTKYRFLQWKSNLSESGEK